MIWFCHWNSQRSLYGNKFKTLISSSMNEVVHTSPTIGSNVEEIVVNNTHFLMWDIGGQESLRSSWNTYYTNTEVDVLRYLWTGEWNVSLTCVSCVQFVIVVVDSTDRERISVTREELYRMLAHEASICQRDCTFFLVCAVTLLVFTSLFIVIRI